MTHPTQDAVYCTYCDGEGSVEVEGHDVPCPWCGGSRYEPVIEPAVDAAPSPARLPGDATGEHPTWNQLMNDDARREACS